MSETIYFGTASARNCEYEVTVKEGNALRTLDPRLDLANHSPTGLSWGYAGSGPAQCALALLAHATDDNQRALKSYQRFKARVVARLPNIWQLSRSQILNELKIIEAGE